VRDPGVTVTRLGRSEDVRRVLTTGRHRAGRLLAVHALTRPDVDPATAASPAASPAPTPARPTTPAADVRLTVVASRRVGHAVQRNRAKRLLRAAAQGQPWQPGTDVVLVARAATVTSTMPTVRDELERLGHGLGVLTAVSRRGPA